MRILVIEDEAKTAKFLKKGLCEAGFLVETAVDGLAGLEFAQEGEFDLVILLLSLFARRPGEVLSRTLIAESVWDMNFDSARTWWM